MTARKKISNQEFVPISVLLGGEAVEIVDPAEEVREILEQARRQAATIIEQAGEQAGAIEKEAAEKGYREGLDRGEQQGRQLYLEKIAELEKIMAGLAGQRAAVQRQYESDLRHLVTAVVRRLVHHEISVNPRIIAACLRHAMQFVAHSARVRVRLHPDDFQRLREASLEDDDLLAGKEQVDLFEDPALTPGGCVITTDFGEIDATVEQFQERLLAVVDQGFLAALAEDNEPAGEEE